jgi:Fe-S cluster assembly protein SufB
MWGCLLGDALVFTSSGPKPIRDVKVGESVWSQSGGGMSLRRVVRSGCVGYKRVLKIRTRDRSLEATANHEFLVRRKFAAPREGVGGYRAVEWRNVWVRADKITTSDYLVLAHGQGNGGGDVAPNGRRLTEQFMEVCGLYIAEGSMNERAVVVARADDAPYMPAYREAIRGSFVKADGSAVVVREQVRSTAFSSVLAVGELRELGFGGIAATKRVPGWVFGLDRSLILAFLRGYLDGDGSVNRRGWIAWTSINRSLIEDVRHLCILCGIPIGEACGYPITYGFGDRPRKTPGIVWQAWSFSAEHNRTIGSHDPRYIERWALVAASNRVGRFDPEYVGRGAGGARPGVGFKIQGAVISRVVAIDPASDDEFPVYDIEVEGTHNFVANGIVVHNSGVEAIINEWLILGLDSFWHNIESSINKRLLSPKDRQTYYAEFDRDGLLRADSVARANFMSTLIHSGLKTPNELRKKNNDHPLDGGDVLLINSTLIPLTDAGRLAGKLPRPAVVDAPPTPAETVIPSSASTQGTEP